MEVDPRVGRTSSGRVCRSCVHCKEAHVSCSVPKPCERCVRRGLQCVEAPVRVRRRRTREQLQRERGDRDSEGVTKRRKTEDDAVVEVGTLPLTGSVRLVGANNTNAAGGSPTATSPFVASTAPDAREDPLEDPADRDASLSFLQELTPFGSPLLSGLSDHLFMLASSSVPSSSTLGDPFAECFDHTMHASLLGGHCPTPSSSSTTSTPMSESSVLADLASLIGIPGQPSRKDFVESQSVKDLLGMLREYVRLRRVMQEMREKGVEAQHPDLEQQQLHLRGVLALLRERFAEIATISRSNNIPLWRTSLEFCQERMTPKQREVAMNAFYYGAIPTSLWAPLTTTMQSLLCCNPAFQDMFELSWCPEDTSSPSSQQECMLKFEELIHPDDLDRVLQSFQALFEKGFRGDAVITGKCSFVTLKSKKPIPSFFASHIFRSETHDNHLLYMTQFFPRNGTIFYSSATSTSPSPSSDSTPIRN